MARFLHRQSNTPAVIRGGKVRGEKKTSVGKSWDLVSGAPLFSGGQPRLDRRLACPSSDSPSESARLSPREAGQRARGPGAWRRFEGRFAGQTVYGVLSDFNLRASANLELCSFLHFRRGKLSRLSAGLRPGRDFSLLSSLGPCPGVSALGAPIVSNELSG